MRLRSMRLRSHVVMEVALGGRRSPAARPLHSSTRVSAKMKVQRASPGPPLLNNLKDLRGPEFFTVLPTPLAVSEQGAAEHQHHFPDSSVMAHVAIIDACLTDFYDVPRAESIFAELRRDRRADSILNYNRADEIVTGEDRFVARFLRLLPAKKLVIIAIMELLAEPSHGDSVRTTHAIIQVGKAIDQL